MERAPMYSRCYHCNAELGANEVIESFPVGRRLAFDAAKGRLWVVCPRCHRWNLSPLDARWEAIEQCEREFRATRLRASTDNIGMARTREGLELVRIGAPRRPEMAAWRYAREFRRRWMTRGVPLAAGSGVIAGTSALITNDLTGISVGLGVIALVAGGSALFVRTTAQAGLVLPDGRVKQLTSFRRMRACLHSDRDSAWSVTLSDTNSEISASGPDAERALRSIMTIQNFQGARDRRVRDATTLLDDAGSPDRFLRRLARTADRAGAADVWEYPAEVSLALEMAVHDETERHLLDGELRELEREWALAEEIAGIADNLMLPEDVLHSFHALVKKP